MQSLPSTALTRSVFADPAWLRLDELRVDERTRDVSGVLIPKPHVHVVVRFGSIAAGGLDVHALGAREEVHRKTFRAGLRTVTARLPLGAAHAVLGASPEALGGDAVELDHLWRDGAARRLREDLARAVDVREASLVLERAIAERAAVHASRLPSRSDTSRLAIAAAARLAASNVNEVAAHLGVSERHLRRAFRETVGVGPKTYAKLMRFDRAVRDARAATQPNWASIAATAGYYDQAHLIAEFRAIAGATPRAFLSELRSSGWVG